MVDTSGVEKDDSGDMTLKQELQHLAKQGGPRRAGAFKACPVIQVLLSDAGLAPNVNTLLELTDRASLLMSSGELRKVYRASFRRPPYDAPLLEDRLDECAGALAEEAKAGRLAAGRPLAVPRSSRTMSRLKDVALEELATILRGRLDELVPTPRGAAAPPARPIPGDRSGFVADVTIPDGRLVRPAEVFEKQWLLRNAGTIEWRHRYLVRIGTLDGPETPARVRVPDTAPGEQALICVQVRAPERPGSYEVTWKMADENGHLFFPDRYFRGIWFLITVIGAN